MPKKKCKKKDDESKEDRRSRLLAMEGLLEPEAILGIDKNLLDDEWIAQPKMCLVWSLQLENAEDDFEAAKTNFEVVKAEVELEIRNNPERCDELPEGAVEKNKVTEKMVASAMIRQTKYAEAQQEWIQAKYRVGVLRAAVKSIDHRKKALEKLVDLHGQQYFASPRASDRSKEAVDEIEKRHIRGKGRHKHG